MEVDRDSARLILSTISASWSWIGGDLWLLIFYRLPIETLCRFRCVCKSWNSLISSPFFINLHHSFNSSATPPNLKPYLLSNDYRTPNCYSLHRPQSEDLYFPFLFRKSIKFVDVVRGVVCASFSEDSSFDSTVLWNPAIRRYVALPRLAYPSHLAPSEFPDEDYYNSVVRFSTFAIGFGYDSSNNDFKVVRIRIPMYSMEQHHPKPAPAYEVYSAREGLWREGIIADINLTSCELDPDTSRTGCFMNGIIHWVLSKPSAGSFNILYFVLMFDCELEQFTMMELPREIYKPTMKAVEEYQTAVALPEDEVYPLELAFDALVDGTKLEILEHAGLLSVLVTRQEWEPYVELWGMNRAPFDPNQWIKFRDISTAKFANLMLGGRVYEDSMFLMEDTKGQSYMKGEIVRFGKFYEYPKFLKYR